MQSTLLHLAQIGTEQARCELFGKLCEFITANLDDRTIPELTIFSEIALKLYRHATVDDRARLARDLENCPIVPHDLALRLATDEASIAIPILRGRHDFAQGDLLGLVHTLGPHQREAIATRPDLSPKVSDALVLNGEEEVHRLLAGNTKIRLSRQAMQVFVQRAVEDSALRECLVLRPDLTPAVCQKLLPLVDDDAKKRLHGIIEAALSQEQLEQIARLKTLRREFGPALDNQDMSLLWADAKRAGASVDELVLLLLQDNRYNHVIELMGICGRIAQKALKDAVYNGKTDVVLRTAARCNLKPHTFSLFVKARCAHLRIPANQGAEWVNAYGRYLKKLEPATSNRCDDFKANRAKQGAADNRNKNSADLAMA